MKIHKNCVTEVITRKTKGRHFAYKNELKNIVKNVPLDLKYPIRRKYNEICR